jgi:hypothetical protein
MAMFEAGATRRNEWFEQFRVFRDFLQETKGGTTDVLIGMLLDG